MQRFNTKKITKNVSDSYNAQFIKQVPIHPRDRLVRATKNAQRDDDDIEFTKQVPIHPKDRLAMANLSLICIGTKTLKHLRDRMREKELKIARENVSALMRRKFEF